MVRRLIETETDFDQFSDRHQAAGNLPDLNIGADIESAFRNALSSTCFENKIVDILKKAEKSNINIISPTDRYYPKNYLNLYSPPLFLSVIGSKLNILKKSNIITVIGSRRPSPYGKGITQRFVSEWSALGVTLCSGLARGIDGLAHEAALNEGAIPSPSSAATDIVYPADNENIYNDIKENGLIVSEYLPGTPPRRQHFPARNRLLSSLGRCLIVVEATRRSGTMITTDFALDQSIPVLAVPGNINSPASQGTNRLIQDGCDVLLEPADLIPYLDIEALGSGNDVYNETYHTNFCNTETAQGISQEAEHILSYLAAGPLYIEDLKEFSNLDSDKFYYWLTELELVGKIAKQAGRYYRCQ